MMRLMLLSCAFVGLTGGLIVALLPPAEDSDPINTVSRAQAAPLSLQPAMPSPSVVQPAPAPAAVILPEPAAPQPTAKPEPAVVQIVPQTPAPTPVRPQGRPADLVPVSAPAAVTPPPAPVLAVPLVAPRAPSVASSTADVDDTVNAIGHSIVQQLMQPVPRTQAPAPVQRQAVVIPAPKPVPAPAPAPKAPDTVQYVVQDGDSLPGLAFRFFGTTAAYLKIVDANPILRDDPQAFRSGLTIEIPKTQ